MNENKINIVRELIEDVLDSNSVIALWNSMAGHSDGKYSMIYIMENLDLVFEKMKPKDIIAAVYNNDRFSLEEKYFMYSEDNGLVSFNGFPVVLIDSEVKALAEYLIKEMPDALLKHKSYLIDGFIDSHRFFNWDEAKRVLETMMAFGYVNILQDDWDTLYDMVSSLMQEK